jgi:hypothetical protein
VTASGVPLARHAWSYDAASGRLTVTLPAHSVHSALVVTYH